MSQRYANNDNFSSLSDRKTILFSFIIRRLTNHKELLSVYFCLSQLFFLYLCKMFMSNKKLR